MAFMSEDNAGYRPDPHPPKEMILWVLVFCVETS